MHDVAWRGIWIYVRSKDAQKQLARTSLTHARGKLRSLLLRGLEPRLRKSLVACSEI